MSTTPPTVTAPPGCDIFLSIGCTRSAGRWFYELTGYRPLQNMAAGLQVSATTHTLLALSLASALRSISQRATEIIIQRASAQGTSSASGNRRRVRVGIRCAEHDFLNCLSAGINRSTPGFRCAASLRFPLVKQLRRFDITLMPTSPFAVQQVSNWAASILPSQRFWDGLAAPLAKRKY